MTPPRPATAQPRPAATTPIITDPRIRPIAAQDADRTAELIMELAIYEKMPEQCHVRPQQLRAALFAEHPAVFGLAAFDSDTEDAKQVGYALYFLNFSTWEGVHGIFLEDLYVTPAHRGTGLGRAMLTCLAATATARGYARVEWSVLDWNRPSIEFYESLGAAAMAGWTGFRLSGAALRQLGAAHGHG